MEGIQNKRNQVMGLAFIIVVMVGAVGYILKDESISDVISAIQGIDPWFLILGIAMMIAYILCEGINIWVVMKGLGKRINFINSLGYGFIGFYFSSITPSASGGQPAQVYFMNRDDISITSSSLGLMVMLFAHQLVIVILGIIGMLLKPEFTILDLKGFKILLIFGLASNAIILFGILALIFYPVIIFKISKLVMYLIRKARFIKKKDEKIDGLRKSMEEYREGAVYIRDNPKTTIKVILITAVQIFLYFAIPYAIYRGFGYTQYSLMDLVLTQAVLNIAVSSLPLPGAVGVSESVFVTMFKKFYPGNLVIPGMLLTRIANFYFVLILSGLVSLLMYVKKKEEVYEAN